MLGWMGKSESFLRHVSPSVSHFFCTHNSAAPTGYIFSNFGIGDFYKNLLRNCKFRSNRAKISGNLNEDQTVFRTLSAIYVAQKHTRHITELSWQSFQYLLHCWQRHLYVNNANGRYFCFSKATMVTPACHYITW